MTENLPFNPSRLTQVGQIVCRGVRGATTVATNEAEDVLEATRELLYVMLRANHIHQGDVASATFSTTPDVTATFPAIAARQMGWHDVPLICGHEMVVPNSLKMCIRIMLHWNTDKAPQDIYHIYLREAQSLRPDKGNLPEIPWEEIEAAVKNFDLGTLPPTE